MSLPIGEATSAASPSKNNQRKVSRHRIDPRLTVVLSVAALFVACISLILNSAPYQDWRLSHLKLDALQSELRSRGENSCLLYYIGLRLDEQKRFGEADGYLRQGVGLDPDSPRLREEWARALLGSGKTTAAFGELQEFAGTHPRNAAAHFVLGKFYYAQRSMKRAAEEFERAIALDPGNAQAYLNLAGARSDLRENEAAWQAATRATALQPDSPEAHLILASLSTRIGKPAEQIRAEFERALRLAPRNGAAHGEYARWLLDSTPLPAGPKLAEEHARLALKYGSEDGLTFLTLARALVYQQNNAGAVDPLLRAMDLMPNDPAPVLALAQAYRASGNARDAAMWQREYVRRQTLMTEKQALLQAVTVAPDDSSPKERLAHWLGRHGDADGCAHNHSMALHRALDSPAVLIAASRDLVAGGYANLALPLAQSAADFAGRSPDAHEALGDALLGLKQVKEAADEYNLAIRLEPSRSDALIGRLRSFVALHRDDPQLRSIEVRTLTGTPQNKNTGKVHE